MRHRGLGVLLFALWLGALAPASAQAAPKPGLWSGISGDGQVSFVISGGHLTELVVSCHSVPARLDTARRYRIRLDPIGRGNLSPSSGGPPMRGRLGRTTGKLTLTSPPPACASARQSPLNVHAMPSPRAREGIYHATGPAVTGNGGLDITFRIDGGGGVIRDIRGHVDALILGSAGATPCTVIYDGLPDQATTLTETSNSTELGFVSFGPSPGLPSIQAATTNVGGAPDVPPDQFRGTALHGMVPGCGTGGGLLVANLEVLEATAQGGPGDGSASCPDRHDRRNPRPARTPLQHAHAHNDYEHRHPLFDALSHRFASVEADVWLTADGQLAVGHDRNTLSYPQCTLQALYLDPLQALVQANGGHVYSASHAPVQLVVDVKVDARDPALAKLTIAKSYLALEQLLRERYASMLSSWSGGVEHPGPVRVVLTGAIDRVLMNSLPQRYAAYEGGLHELGSGPQTGPTPFISADWADFKKAGNRAEPFVKWLRDTVIQAHAHGQQVRFWNTPEPRSGIRSFRSRAYRRVWREERAAHVDWLNTDNLRALEDFLD